MNVQNQRQGKAAHEVGPAPEKGKVIFRVSRHWLTHGGITVTPPSFLDHHTAITRREFKKWWHGPFVQTVDYVRLSKATKRHVDMLLNNLQPMSFDRSEQPEEVVTVLEAWEAIPLKPHTTQFHVAMIRYMAELMICEDFSPNLAEAFGATTQDLAEARRMVYKDADGILDIHRVPGGPWYHKDIGGDPQRNRFETVLTSPEGKRIHQASPTFFDLESLDPARAKKEAGRQQAEDEDKGQYCNTPRTLCHHEKCWTLTDILDALNTGSPKPIKQEAAEDSTHERVLNWSKDVPLESVGERAGDIMTSEPALPNPAPASGDTTRHVAIKQEPPSSDAGETGYGAGNAMWDLE
ncbi:MAG: hypothetical protein Q9183_005714 [Haloplaca sp. 2 TL-2023]